MKTYESKCESEAGKQEIDEQNRKKDLDGQSRDRTVCVYTGQKEHAGRCGSTTFVGGKNKTLDRLQMKTGKSKTSQLLVENRGGEYSKWLWPKEEFLKIRHKENMPTKRN